MKVLKISITLLVIGVLISCVTGREVVSKQVPTEWDKIFARYPKYRIDDKIQKICILGSGEGKNEITNFLTDYFIKSSNVKVVETGNLQAILGGKIIEYGTGLSYSESQALSQMLQIDHILLFEEKISPHRDYQYGGRGSVTINLKIVNTLNGEVLYQSGCSLGINTKDPRDYGYREAIEMPTYVVNRLRLGCFHSLRHELTYAIGRYDMGILVKGDENIVNYKIVNSLSDKAGIEIKDKILEVNGKKIQRLSDIPKEETKQGDVVIIKVEREGKILEFNIKIPIIPFRPEEEKKEKAKDKKIQL